MLANYAAVTGSPSLDGVPFTTWLDTSLTVLNGRIFTDAYRDDHLW